MLFPQPRAGKAALMGQQESQKSPHSPLWKRGAEGGFWKRGARGGLSRKRGIIPSYQHVGFNLALSA